MEAHDKVVLFTTGFTVQWGKVPSEVVVRAARLGTSTKLSWLYVNCAELLRQSLRPSIRYWLRLAI